MLPPVMAVSVLIICRSSVSAAAAHADPNISKYGIHEECTLIFLAARRNITIKYGAIYLLLDSITNEKTSKLIQLDIIARTITRHQALAGSNNSGERTYFSLHIPKHMQCQYIHHIQYICLSLLVSYIHYIQPSARSIRSWRDVVHTLRPVLGSEASR